MESQQHNIMTSLGVNLYEKMAMPLCISQMLLVMPKTNPCTASVSDGLNFQVSFKHCRKISFKTTFKRRCIRM